MSVTDVIEDKPVEKVPEETKTPIARQRANWLPAPHFFNLNHACRLVNNSFGDFGCYLVGSSLLRRDFRDVDVRFIMGDDEFDRLFRAVDGTAGWTNPLWSLMCASISEWLSKQSGLPIDFQIQRQTQANAEHAGLRSALGIVFIYPGELPSLIEEASPAPGPATSEKKA